MKTFRPFTLLMSATVALGLLIADSAAQAAQRLVSVIQRVEAPQAQPTNNAEKTFRIAGTVLDAAGQPVAGAAVERYQYPTARFVSGRYEMELKQRVTTGAKGEFDLRSAPAPTVLLARKPGLAPAWAQIYNQAKDRTDERLVLTPPTSLAGVVVDEADKPVANAEVWVSSAYSEQALEDNARSLAYMSGKPARECFATRTGADGKFVIQGFPTNAAADLAVSAPGRVLRELPREYVSLDTMRCRAGQQDIKLVVEPAGSVEGKVVAQDTGEPLAGMKLWLQANRPGYFGGMEREPAESGADGTFRLADVAAGSYEVHALFGTNRVPDWVAETVPVTVEAGQPTKDVKVSATRGGLLEVTVLGKEDRKPMTDVGVNAYKQAYQTGVSSGSNGVALLRLPPGEYNVSAYKDYSRSEGTTATVENGRTNQLQIELNPPPRITGVVSDPAGAPVPDMELSIFPNWGQSGGGAKTDAKGHYETTWNAQRFGPSGGSFSLMARDVARNLAVAQDIDESTKTLDLQLQPGLIVAGQVQAENGKPLSNATVRVFLWSGNSGSQFTDKPVHTDAQGRFEITAMPPGRKYTLDASAKGYGSANRSVEEDASTNRVEVEACVLKVADRILAGEVIDADEKPVARANVHMYGQGQPNGSVRTDDKGRFKFDAVCEGTIQVSANSQRSYGNARAEAGDTNVVIRLGVNQSYSSREAPRRPSLRGKPLPDLAPVALSEDAVPAGKPLLLCLFDVEQRPSRRFVKQLADQHDALQQKGLTVLAVQASVTTDDSFKEWKEASPVPFPVGRVAEKGAKTKWASDVDSLPWLILTDGDHHVTAEGFALEDLDAKLKAQAKP